ncbi:putative disease resistance RPP13-like protein 1 [Tripterygium wilfordii]|uniref:putative disease resistance RPP13-like protein 1 n=1 Tax=Tripterygium wilfordii TaxID=458696 RepID=UPI0018F7FFDB|nr:putative disease resistance RPP13-like protein 1 [Tripterygium wilfordii]
MEIATTVGGALLSASVQQLIERLTSHELNIFTRREKIHADLKDWEIMLGEINSLLDDAEDTQMTNSSVKKWLDEFRDLTYDIEDVLDEFNTEALKRKVMEDPQASTNRLRKFIPTRFTSFGFNIKMASRIKDITKRLHRINVRQAQTLNLRRIANGTRSNQLKERPPTTSLVDESHIYGRNDDKEAIIKMLLCNEEGGNNSFSVIPIVGIGWEELVWVCVSENFDVIMLTRTILRYVAPEIRDLRDLDLNSLQETLKENLSQKKFLLILDDVWEEDYNQWDLLRRPFVSTASSSKIIVTTRKNNAAPITGDVHVYCVKELPDDDYLFLLARHALAAQSFDARLDLKDIGQESVKRCDGLPLAGKVLGGLRNKRSREEWECVLRNKWWNSPETSNNIHPTLKLSYNDLPSHLKRCFAYCALFPKDYEFDRDELFSLWMAEGFLQHPRGRKTMKDLGIEYFEDLRCFVYCAIFPKDYEFERDELVSLWMADGFLQHAQGGKLMEDLGIEYFEDLVSRSFFQSSSNKSRIFYQSISFIGPTNSTRSVFVMHDLISDIAQTIAGDICYNCEDKTEVDMSSSKYEKRLITIWQRGGSFLDRGYNMLDELLTQSKCARVLFLSGSREIKLSNSIGDLIHLRYINLSNTFIQQLPESLPDKISNLVNLRHLDISMTPMLQKLPSGIGMMTNLQTFSKFIVREGHGTTIAELKNLNNLRGSLSVQGLENVQDAKLANIKGKQGLEELELYWVYCLGRNGRNDMSVLESLEPYQNLKRLTISSYCGAEFPFWMSNIPLYDPSQTLTTTWASLLTQELGIIGLKAVKTIGVEFYGNVVPFPSLERLEIGHMSEWRDWSHGNMSGEGFPNPQELRLYDCPKLIWNFPSGLPCSLECIEVKNCDALECFPMINTRDGRESLLEELEIEDCSSQVLRKELQVAYLIKEIGNQELVLPYNGLPQHQTSIPRNRRMLKSVVAAHSNAKPLPFTSRADHTALS